MKKKFVLDTNVLLHSAQSLTAFQDNLVVIPMTVIEELDKFKKHQDELGRNSRHVVRQLDALRTKGSLFTGVPLDNAAGGKEAGTLKVVTGEYEPVKGMDMSVPDNRILRTAWALHEKDPNVWLVTKDINLRLKADSLGIPVQDYETQKINADELYSGQTERIVPAGTIAQLFANGSLPLPDQEIYPNEFVILKEDSDEGKTLLTWSREDALRPVKLSMTDKVWNILPRSMEQRMALALLMEPSIPLVTLVGLAGSGKTLLALAAALACVVKQELYDKILVSRPIIPMGNDLGYLPGDKDEKLAVWMQPIFDNLDFLFRSEDGKESTRDVRKQVEALKRSHQLELEALTYIRGRSIPRQFMIVDEAQNLTPHEIKTIVSRAGEGTKIVLTGDPNQIDNPYLDASSNGLSYVAEHLKDLPVHGHITLRKSERSELASAAAEYL